MSDAPPVSSSSEFLSFDALYNLCQGHGMRQPSKEVIEKLGEGDYQTRYDTIYETLFAPEGTSSMISSLQEVLEVIEAQNLDIMQKTLNADYCNFSSIDEVLVQAETIETDILDDSFEQKITNYATIVKKLVANYIENKLEIVGETLADPEFKNIVRYLMYAHMYQSGWTMAH
jgi:hypothetical protein